VIAIGGKDDRIGAMRLHATDCGWRKMVSHLAAQAALIFMIPHSSQGVVWEMKHIVEEGMAHKAIFIMPPNFFFGRKFSSLLNDRSDSCDMEEVWSDLISNGELCWAEIPSYYPQGCVFTLNNNGEIRDWDALGMELLPWILASGLEAGPGSTRSDSSERPSSIDGISLEAGNLDDVSLGGDAITNIDMSYGAMDGGSSGGHGGDGGSVGGFGGDGGGGFGGDGGGSGSSGGGSGGGGP
jgi:hypothetical protein